MLAAFVVSYMEAVQYHPALLMRPVRMSAADNLAFLVFQRDFLRWKKSRHAN